MTTPGTELKRLYQKELMDCAIRPHDGPSTTDWERIADEFTRTVSGQAIEGLWMMIKDLQAKNKDLQTQLESK